MVLTRLSEPSDILLEHLLVATSRQEQFAIVGRVANHLSCRLEGNTADGCALSKRLADEAKLRRMTVDALVTRLINVIVERSLFDALLRPCPLSADELNGKDDAGRIA